MLLVHVPPVDGVRLRVLPSHTTPPEGTVIIGNGFTVIVPEEILLEHPVIASVNTTVVVPAEIPVTNPVLSIVAIAELLLVHVPPVDGVRLRVLPSHTTPPEGTVIIGEGSITTGSAKTSVQGAAPTV